MTFVKFIFIAFLLFSANLYAKKNIIVSIVPQQFFVNAIGANKVNITTMVSVGNSPHSYSPKPSQMLQVSKADIYFAIGIEFEDIWLNKLTNGKTKIVDISKNIPLIDKIDPHIWTSLSNAKVIALNILNALVDIDSKNKSYYENNYQKLLSKINNTHKEIKQIFLNTPKDFKFIVLHPAWGYFAKEYSLSQLPIRIHGHEPKPKDVIKIINTARKNKSKVLFTSPEFSQKIANQIVKELDIKIVKISPLSPKYFSNLLKLAKSIAQ